LLREQTRLVCPAKHSFDIARSGYINLLQPQDRRSKQPGDSAAVIAARRRMHDRGVSEPLLRAIAQMLSATPRDVVLDAGCGDGFYLGSLARQTGFHAHGVDISIPAIDSAARRYPQCEWIVANADRLLPYADHAFSIVTSITARMNPDEFRRVTTLAELSADEVRDVFHFIYRPLQPQPASAMAVTFGLDLLLFHPRA
jgi:23S rRNA (guanine745-N1)-methyltransferase